MDIACEMIEMGAVIFEIAMCFVFVASFMNENVLKDHIAGIGVTLLFDVIFNYITMQIEIYSVLRFMVFVVSTLVVQFLFYRKYYGRIIVMTITYMLIMALMDYCTVVISSYLLGIELNYFKEMTLYRICATIVSKGILLITILLVQKKMRGLKDLRRSHLFCVFGISGTILLFILYLFKNFMQRNYVLASEAMLFMLLLLIEILSLYSFAAMTENHKKEENLHLLGLYNQVLHNSLEEEKHSFDLWSGRVHDYKNHVIYMLGLLENGEYELLKKYMQDEAGILKHQSSYIQSGYKGIDAIINSKMLYARSRNIHMFCNVRIPEGLLLDEMAMVTILGNLLDNAIRAEMNIKEKLIEVNIDYIKENIYIKIVNHKEHGEIDFDNSSKEHPEWHGIGLRSVKGQIKKLQGDFKVIQKENTVISIAVIYEVGKSGECACDI